MYASTTAYATMIDDARMVYEAKVSITLPGGVYPDITLAVESLSIEASITTDVPEGKRIQEGIPALTATVTLKGAVDSLDPTKTAAWLFGSYQTTSPLYRKSVLQAPVTIDIGAYPDGSNGVPELFRKFTGVVSRKPVVKDGTVTLTCVDLRGTWRNAVPDSLVNVSGASNSGLTAEFVLDSIARQSSKFACVTWPTYIADCVVAAGMRTSTYPELGKILVAHSPSFAPGRFGSALAGATSSGLIAGTPTMPQNSVAAEYVFSSYIWGDHSAAAPSTGMAAEFFTTGDLGPNPAMVVFSNAPSSVLSGSYDGYVYFKVKSTGIDIVSSNFATKSWVGTIAPGPHHIALFMDWSTTGTVSITVIVDGVGHQITPFTAGKFAQACNYVNVGFLTNLPAPSATIEAFQVSNNFTRYPDSAFPFSYTFAPTAHIDPSLNALSVVPPLAGDSWGVVQQIAQAELGIAGFDESGAFFFKNRNTLRAATSVRQLTSKTAIAELDVEDSVDGLANRVQVEATPYQFGATSTIWQLDEPAKIPRNSSVTFNASFSDPLVGIDGTFTVLPNNSTDTTHSFYRLSVDQAGTASVSASGITFALVQRSGTAADIIVTNGTARDVWLVSPASNTDITVGTPVLRLAGRIASPGSATVTDVQWPPLNADGTGGAAGSVWHEVLCQINGNPWLQSTANGAQLAQFILEDLPVPRPNLVNVAIFPDVRLQAADRVQIVDDDVHGINEYALIFGWSLQIRRAELSMSIDARTVASPGAGILGVTGRNELGTNTNL